MNDTTKARRFIKENYRKMDRPEIVRKLYKMTNLNKSTIQNLYAERENIREYAEEKLTGKDGIRAKVFIENNIDKMTEEEIIYYLVKNTRLNEFSAEAIYNYVKDGENFKEEEEFKPKEEVKYKGRTRSVFMIDDSKLYRSVNGESKRRNKKLKRLDERLKA